MIERILPESEQGIQYTLHEIVGKGGYATVYKSYDSEGTEVAVKVHTLPDDASNHVQNVTVAHVASEVALLQKTNHPHVVQYVDHSVNKERPYIVMEYVPETLGDIVRKGKVTQSVVIDFIRQIPTLLALLQEYEIAHCDLKCSNIGYVDRTLKLLDFGLAIPFSDAVFRIMKNVPPYCPPEFFPVPSRFSGYGNIGIVKRSSDTFSAGKALEFMLTGTYAPSIGETMTNIKETHEKATLPKEFQDFLKVMVARESIQRARKASPDKLRNLADKAVKALGKKVIFKKKQPTGEEIPSGFSSLMDMLGLSPLSP
ncbi:hypothetical protein COV17_00620 [Candidatus Woesearchaeota archaeon CG10_big_fil_rev_8_21_14_0_10_36_11]|nr:MAG: hypothetical protein COV17_00620 [Candidatus Woesearchaeota archaeon CG10_big_fil_rev_8_21_14_0_10_36_11]